MINKITHPSFKSIYIQESMYNQLSPENKSKIKTTAEFLGHLYQYTNDIFIFNNKIDDICYQIQGAHPASIMLHPEAIKLFKNPEQVQQQVLLAITLTNIFNNIHNIKIPFTKGIIKDINNKTTKEVGLQIIKDVEEFNHKTSQKGYLA